MHVFFILYAVPDASILNDISCMSQHTTTLITALAGGLSSLCFLLIAITATAIVCICVLRSKKKPERETDVCYDTINIGQHPVFETKLNVAYHHPKKLK